MLVDSCVSTIGTQTVSFEHNTLTLFRRLSKFSSPMTGSTQSLVMSELSINAERFLKAEHTLLPGMYTVYTQANITHLNHSKLLVSAVIVLSGF